MSRSLSQTNSPLRQLVCVELSSSDRLTYYFFERVFLSGKEHIDYRRGLNTLFTRKALG